MAATDDYCELCDLPKSQCVHGQPPPAPKPATEAKARRAAAPKPRKRAASASRATSAASTKPVSRRWTPPEVLAPLVLEVLRESGGELAADDVFAALAARLDGRMLPGDTETTPEGELRWRYAARRARQALITEGLMTKGAPGMWTLAAGS